MNTSLCSSSKWALNINKNFFSVFFLFACFFFLSCGYGLLYSESCACERLLLQKLRTVFDLFCVIVKPGDFFFLDCCFTFRLVKLLFQTFSVTFFASVTTGN